VFKEKQELANEIIEYKELIEKAYVSRKLYEDIYAKNE